MRKHKAQALDISDAQIDAVYDYFENGAPVADIPGRVIIRDSFTRTMGRRFDGTRMRNYN